MFFMFLVPAAAQCMGCESACFLDCHNKYGDEIIDPDHLPGGGGFAGALAQSDKKTDAKFELLKQHEASYLDCMEQEKQCTVTKATGESLAKYNKKAKSKVTLSAAMRMKQKADNAKCIEALATDGVKPVKKSLRKAKASKALVQEVDHPKYFYDHGTFKHGYLELAQCVDICISTYCPCPSSTGDFMSRYPADVSEGAAEAGGLPTADESDDVQEVISDVVADMDAGAAPAPSPSASPSPSGPPASQSISGTISASDCPGVCAGKTIDDAFGSQFGSDLFVCGIILGLC